MIRRLRPALNPILLKELRQAVRSRFITVSYCLFLLLLVMVTGGVLWSRTSAMLADPGAMLGAGRGLFQALFAPLSLVCILFVPAYTGIRLAAELGTGNMDLQFVTRLTPGAVLRGKLLCGIALGSLMVSAALPFLTLTFRLGGIDLPSAFVVLAMLLAMGLFATLFALMLATLPGNRVWRILIGLAGGGTLFNWMMMLNMGVAGMIATGIGSQLATAQFWQVAVLIVLGGIAVGGLFFMLATARISPPTANRALPVRIWMSAAWLVTGLVFAGLAIYKREVAYLIPWIVLSCLLSMAAMGVACSERTTLSRRVRRAIPRRRVWRLLVFPFFSGADSGMLWAVLLGGGTLLIARRLEDGFARLSFDSDTEMVLAGLLAYTFAYCQTARLLQYPLRKWLPDKAVWVLALVLLAAGMLTPVLVGMSDRALMAHALGAWTAGNPVALFYPQHRWGALRVAGVWSGVLLIPYLLRTLGTLRAFAPLEPDGVRQAPGDAALAVGQP